MTARLAIEHSAETLRKRQLLTRVWAAVVIAWSVIRTIVIVVPDVYIFEGTRTLPTKVIVILCLVIVTMFSLATATVVRKVRVGRAARLLALEAAAVHGNA